MGWPIECWDVSTAFLYAPLFGYRDTDLGGNETFMRPTKILVETEVVSPDVVIKTHGVVGRGALWASNCAQPLLVP